MKITKFIKKKKIKTKRMLQTQIPCDNIKMYLN